MQELDKDIKERGFALLDQETGKRINPETIAIMTNPEKKPMIPEAILLSRLDHLKNLQKKKFGIISPYNLELFKKDPAAFTERMIRAVEICTLNYVLGKDGGTLNLNDIDLIMGKKKMVWED